MAHFTPLMTWLIIVFSTITLTCLLNLGAATDYNLEYTFRPRLFDKNFSPTPQSFSSTSSSSFATMSSSTSSTLKSLGGMSIVIDMDKETNDRLFNHMNHCHDENDNNTCQHYYLIQTKSQIHNTYEQLNGNVDTLIHPYQVVHRINREMVIVSGPINPSLDLIQRILPHQLLTSTTTPSSTTSSTSSTSHQLVDLLSLASRSDELIQLLQQLGYLEDKKQVKLMIKFFHFLQQVNLIDAIVGISHFTPSMKISNQHLDQLGRFYTPQEIVKNGYDDEEDDSAEMIDESGIITDSNLNTSKPSQYQSQIDYINNIISVDNKTMILPNDYKVLNPSQRNVIKSLRKLQTCLYETTFDQKKKNSIQTEGQDQIETDAYLDIILNQHLLTKGKSNNDNFVNVDNMSFDEFSQYSAKTPSFLTKLMNNVNYRDIDNDGISMNIIPVHPCHQSLREYNKMLTTFQQLTTLMTHSTVNSTKFNQDKIDDIVSLLDFVSNEMILHIKMMPMGNHRQSYLDNLATTTPSCSNFIFTPSDNRTDTFYMSIVTDKGIIPTMETYKWLQSLDVLNNEYQQITLQLATLQTTLNTCINSILLHPYVMTILIQPIAKTQNNKAKYILQDRKFQSTKMWSKGLTGAGQTVIVGDTGVDYDHCLFHDNKRPTRTNTGHIGTISTSSPDYLQRKIIWYLSDWGDSTDDSGGHGTHVAGTIAGYVDPGYPSKDVQNALLPYSGHGKDTKLVVLDFKKTGVNGLNIPSDLYHQIFQPITTKVPSAGISSHSWGGDVGYTSYSLSTDDYCYNNPYHLVVFAGGNNGVGGFTTILSPGDSKNVLTVGATENLNELPGLAISAPVPQGQIPFESFTDIIIPYVMAAFGRSSMVLPQSTVPIVVAENIEGCETLKSDLYNTRYTDAIVLVRRGGCSFVTKANYVYAAGAAVVLVVNNIDVQPVQMGVDTTTPTYQRSFSVAMVAKRYGELLIRYAENNRTPTTSQSAFITTNDINNNNNGTHIITPTQTPIKIPLTGRGPVQYQGQDSFSHAMADFSSRGPTRDGRIKPDIVAPGKTIYSARSDGTVGSVNCPTSGGVVALSGTSMATPAVAGEMSLIRQYFEDGFYLKYLNTYLDPYYNGSGETQPAPIQEHDITMQSNNGNNKMEVPFTMTSMSAVEQLKKNLKLTSAALKTLAIASAQSAQGRVLSSKTYLTVTYGPMSPFQGWGLFNVDRILQFEDDPASYSLLSNLDDITIKAPSPPSRLYTFDSLTEDVSNIRYTLLTNGETNDAIPSNFKTAVKKAKDGKKVDATGSNLYTIDKLPDLLKDLTSTTQQKLSSEAVTMVTSPYSFVLDNVNEQPNFQRCAPAIQPGVDKPTNANDELYSCALTAHSHHQHCLSIQPEDILHNIEYTMYNGAQPSAVFSKNTTPLSFHNVLGNAEHKTADYIDAVVTNFANPSVPTLNDPPIARATLVWTDPAGTEQDERALINNLDLVVHSKSKFRVLITPTSVALITTVNNSNGTISNHLSDHLPIDWKHYKTLFPRSFALTDQMLEANGYSLSTDAPVTGSSIKTHFAASFFHLNDKNAVFMTGNSHTATENQKDLKTAPSQSFVDVINNVEQASLTATQLNINAYVFAAAIQLGQAIDFNVVIKSGTFSKPLQHYAITVTGALPAGFYIPTHPNTLTPTTQSFGAELNQYQRNQQLGLHQPRTLGQQESQQQQQPQQLSTHKSTLSSQNFLDNFNQLRTATVGTCSIESLQSNCPNNCNRDTNPYNMCVAGKCLCSSRYIPSIAYDQDIKIQFTGSDCSVKPTVLDSLCYSIDSPTNNSCPFNSNIADKVSSPLISTTSKIIQPFDWHYYTLPHAIVNQTVALKVGSKDPKNNLLEYNQVVSPDTVYIGIKFNVRVADATQASLKGDPDLYISNNGIPTLSNFHYANRICDTCTAALADRKRNTDATPRSHPALRTRGLQVMGFVVDGDDYDNVVVEEEIIPHSTQSPITKNHYGIDSILQQLYDTHDQMDQQDLNIFSSLLTNTYTFMTQSISSSLSVLGLTDTDDNNNVTDEHNGVFNPLLAPGVSKSSLPKGLIDDKDILWIDGTYFDSSPYRTVTLGVYGNCCHQSIYDLTIYGIHVNDNGFIVKEITPEPPLPIDSAVPYDGDSTPINDGSTVPPTNDNEKSEDDIQFNSTQTKMMFTIFFLLTFMAFVVCVFIMCCKSCCRNAMEDRWFCAPIRMCRSFNKIPVQQEDRGDAQARHGLLYRMFGCYYLTTYLFFCFKWGSLTYDEQVNNKDEATLNNGSLRQVQTPQPSQPPTHPPSPGSPQQNGNSSDGDSSTRSNGNNRNGNNNSIKTKRRHNDVLRVSDLPQPDNPFGGASNHTYTSSSHNIKVAIPQAAQSRLHDFEDDNTRDHFILEQQDINVEQPDQFGGPNTEWDLPQDPLQMIAQQRQ